MNLHFELFLSNLSFHQKLIVFIFAQNQEKAYRLEKECITRWTVISDMLRSHVKVVEDI